MAGDDALVWIDCEMTGLDPETDEILEIFCIITTGTLEVVDAAGWGVVVHQPPKRLAQMGAWCAATHERSGLTAASLASTVSAAAAAEGLLAYVRRHVPQAGTALLAGNSVHADRAFLARGPYRAVLDHLHYRILDVSSLKEAARRWCPAGVLAGAPVKRALHQARNDILESIAEARYYKDAIFAGGGDDGGLRWRGESLEKDVERAGED
ncbi:exonuclease [Durotheca rogersii]|uniref:exonuclease n=1 Tax=Durotheca rogersii TaxID=419775 RepID=UPI002220C463|nr:exonuclease [Durotheca rogersii]KAI5868226.1 exonuclease [Durotheca rogersii]